MVLNEQDRDLIRLIQDGLPLCERPYQTIAEQLGISEQAVVERIQALKAAGIIKRFGIVVRHRELGYTANAMVVWNVPDEQIEQVAQAISRHECVTLCYQRPRRLPDWPYNLFCMIHGKDRQRVLDYIQSLIAAENLHHIPHAVLFSRRRFKQRGAKYL